MQDFVDIVFSFPTVLFTVTTILFLGFWMVTSLIGAGADAFDDLDIDFDADTDIELDTDLDAAAPETSLLRTALEFLGVTNMPLLIALNLFSLTAWFTSVVAMTLVGGAGRFGGIVALVIGLAVIVGSVLAGAALTRSIGRRFSHVFTPTLAVRHRELVGSACTITTSRVSGDFGQAEVRDDEGGSLIVQVRCDRANDLGAGDRVLIFDHDDDRGVFHVSPDRSLAP